MLKNEFLWHFASSKRIITTRLLFRFNSYVINVRKLRHKLLNNVLLSVKIGTERYTVYYVIENKRYITLYVDNEQRTVKMGTLKTDKWYKLFLIRYPLTNYVVVSVFDEKSTIEYLPPVNFWHKKKVKLIPWFLVRIKAIKSMTHHDARINRESVVWVKH